MCRRFDPCLGRRVMLPPDVRALQFGEIRLGDANSDVAWKSLENKCGSPDPERKGWEEIHNAAVLIRCAE